jgi:hypothetical protein
MNLGAAYHLAYSHEHHLSSFKILNLDGKPIKALVPLAGIEPALLAELDFEFGSGGFPWFPHVSGTMTKSLK